MSAAPPDGKGARGFQGAVSYAIGHRIRVEILAALHEGSASAVELEAMMAEALEQLRSWRRLEEIEARAAARCARSAANKTSVQVSSIGFERPCSVPTPPCKPNQ